MRRRLLCFALCLACCVSIAARAAAEAPTVTLVEVYRQSQADSPDWVLYGESLYVLASDADGASDISSVKVTSPDGLVRTVTSSDTGSWRVTASDTIMALFTSVGPLTRLTPLASGPYLVEVADSGGSASALSTPSAQAVPALSLVAPAAGTACHETKPLFQWDTHLPTASVDLTVVEGRSTAPIWQTAVSASQAAYNFDGAASRPELEPGHTYLWTVSALTPEDDRSTDPRVAMFIGQGATARLSVYEPWPALPEVPGQLIYSVSLTSEGPTSTLAYNQDPEVRVWMGPVDAEYGDISPDGTKLVFGKDSLLWVHSLDGSQSYQIPEQTGGDCRWGPDGERIVYSHCSVYGGQRDIWVSSLDGSGVEALTSTWDADERFPVWSPDGGWIAYRRQPDPEGQYLWLIRPDGSEDHLLQASGVAGYPGYEVGYMGEHAWSPDGMRLATIFSAELPSGEALSGIGVLPREGGLILPVFVTPSGVVCCAQPHLPQYSPSGTKIVFNSAHHLAPDPGWAAGMYELGSELWMINANGSGEPVRLTYDHLYDSYVSWWAPPYFWDVVPGHWAYCAVSACFEGGIVVGFADGSYGPELPVSRDQMAVYIARALLGGEAGVPTGPAEPTFGDVGTKHWAYKHIEWAAANGIVQGYKDHTYQPASQLDRAQMAVFIARSTATPFGEEGLAGYVPPETPSFPDADTGFWAYKHIEYIRSHGLISGYLDRLYHPERICTRDQMAVYVAKAFALPM